VTLQQSVQRSFVDDRPKGVLGLRWEGSA